MKNKRIAAVNFIMLFFIFLVVMLYARNHRQAFMAEQIKSFEDLDIAVEQITENYLLSEQRICNVWATYINAEEMDMDEALEYLQKSSIFNQNSCQVLYMDQGYPYGFSTRVNETTGDNGVSYKKMDIFHDWEIIKEIGDGINVTRAFTDPVRGVQSLAFYNKIHLVEDGRSRDCLLLRVIPISNLREKWHFQTEKFNSVEFALVDQEGNYIIKGPSFKNKNFFEFYLSYNETDKEQTQNLKDRIAEGTGTFRMNDSKQNPMLVAYTPIHETEDWKLIADVQMSEIVEARMNWGILLFIAISLALLFLYDLLALRFINLRLKQSAAAAEEASRAKSDFLSAMSHDIRTPMNAIVGMTSIARKNVEDPQKVTECLDKISLANNHLITLVNDILDLSKIESGRIELTETDFSLNELIENIENVSRTQLEAKNIQFELTRNYSQDSLKGDPLRINQIFINLLSNAIKYTNSGGQVKVSLTEAESPSGEDHTRLIWKVADNGVGMSEEFMANMYSSFTRAVDTRINKVEGTGLGLAIVKQLVDLMGGTITCQSLLDQGTTFEVTLDLKKGETGTLSDKEKTTETEMSFADTRILVAEDIEVNWEIMNVMLQEYGMTADHAWNGKECLEMVAQAEAGTWDLILMDIQMPEMNGLDATRAIRALADAKKAAIPIVAMTADAFAENVKACLEAGMNGHVSKPVDMKLVLKEIRKAKE